ncbi:MAG: CRISPR-associated endonuclease Cas2 [Planctomycetota bacterium]|nr:MAG: CRISPR-associated endonuclease Cas2 [Planctomycetota bacterium]
MAGRALSGYRAMWLLVMFDLPVGSPVTRRAYTQFRTTLLRSGFSMLQFSVYGRYCVSEEQAAAYRSLVRRALPAEGQVRVLAVTDRQFGKMEVFYGKQRKRPEKRPRQLVLF